MTTLQYSCLENPKDRGVWRELQSWTWLSDWAYIICSLLSSDLWQASPHWINQSFVYWSTFEPEGYTWSNTSYLLGESHKTFRRSPIQIWCHRNLKRFSSAPQFLDPQVMLLLILTPAMLWEVEQLPHEILQHPWEWPRKQVQIYLQILSIKESSVFSPHDDLVWGQILQHSFSD